MASNSHVFPKETLVSSSSYGIRPAEPYTAGRLGTWGNASYMLLAQFDFPNVYEDGHESLIHRDSDRLQEADAMHTRVVLKRHRCGFTSFNGIEDHGFESWVRKQSKEPLLRFLIDLLKADTTTSWTGCRITATSEGNGHTVFSFELFSRNPNGNTQVWTGEPAPNVLSGRRHG